MKNLSAIKLKEICDNNKYIALRWAYSGQLIGHNCKLASLTRLKKQAEEMGDRETCFTSFMPISFSEYIRIKTPFKS